MLIRSGRGRRVVKAPLRRAVLFDAYPHSRGGAQRVDHEIARLLPKRGWIVEVLAPTGGQLIDDLVAEGLPASVIEAPPALQRYGGRTIGWHALRAVLALPRWWIRLARELRRRRPEIAHVVDHRGLLLAGLPARLAGARLVWHVQAVNTRRLVNRFGVVLAHEIILPTYAVIPKMPGLRRARSLHAVGNIVPDHARRDEPVAVTSEPSLVTTARLHPDKGLDVLIRATAIVRRDVPRVRLTIIGPEERGFPGLRAELEALAAELELADAVEFTGFVPRPAELIARARVYVQPARARFELQPLAILEAMATGIAVVATDVGGVGELVVNDATGLLVPPDDPAALAEAISRILTDEPLTDRLRRAAFELASNRTPDGLADAVAAIYEGKPSEKE